MSYCDRKCARRNLPNPDECHKAADEIERLRRLLLAEENDSDIHRKLYEVAVAERESGKREIERLRAERDEARREVCGLLVACHTDPDDDKPDPNLKHIHAGIRGWDCFKENTNE
jgi:hypothetical protein